MVLSPASTTNPTIANAVATEALSLPALVHSPLGHWWTLIFQQQAKLEQSLEKKLTLTVSKTQEALLYASFQGVLKDIRLQLLATFKACLTQLKTPAHGTLLNWFEQAEVSTVLGLVAQQQQWATKLESLLPEAKTLLAEREQLAFIETVIPTVLLSSQTVRLLNNKTTTPLKGYSLDNLTIVEESIHWLNATSTLQWGDLLQGSLQNLASQYENTLSGLQPLPSQALMALLGVITLGSHYYYYWITTALCQPDRLSHATFWETEALLFEALQFFNNGSVNAVLWHQQLEKLKPETVQLNKGTMAGQSNWFGALETALPTKLHATQKHLKRGEQLQAKLQAGCFISAICEDDGTQLFQTLNDETQPLDIYACLHQITETPCEIKEIVAATWQYQLQTLVPQWLAWMETPTDAQWQMLTNQLVKLETSVLKSIETALLHKTVLGEEV
jgi:hypothetical protein